MIAKSILQVFPELVDNPDGNEYYSVNYDKLGIVALITIKKLVQLLNEKEFYKYNHRMSDIILWYNQIKSL